MLNTKEIIDINLATIDQLQLPELTEKNIKADVLRLDKIHPIISGNKWFKLKYYLDDAVDRKISTIITFGGAYSNHIIATAFAAREYGMKSIGIIRGEEAQILSATLKSAKEYGMKLQFISRADYAKKDNEDILNELHPNSLMIPEGGAGIKGIEGSAEILAVANSNEYTHILCAAGTATTFIGLANGSNTSQEIIGISVLKGISDLLEKNSHYLAQPEKINYCKIITAYDFGGYGKKNTELFKFMNLFYERTGIRTDFVYTGKLFYGAFDLIKNDFFAAGSKLLIIHSGGLQGNDSLPEGTLNF